MNPNYLKTSTTKKIKPSQETVEDGTALEAYNDLDDIPIAELNLNVPLKVHSEY